MPNTNAQFLIGNPQYINFQRLYLFPFRKRKRRTDVVIVRGRLRLYSASGFFLLLGLVILAIGIGMATLGYWPHRETMPSGKTPAGGGSKLVSTGEPKTSATQDTNNVKKNVSEGDGTNSSKSHNVQGEEATIVIHKREVDACRA